MLGFKIWFRVQDTTGCILQSHKNKPPMTREIILCTCLTLDKVTGISWGRTARSTWFVFYSLVVRDICTEIMCRVWSRFATAQIVFFLLMKEKISLKADPPCLPTSAWNYCIILHSCFVSILWSFRILQQTYVFCLCCPLSIDLKG